MKGFWISLISGILGVASVVLAEEATDLTGTFVLNLEKSENLGMMGAVEETLFVSQAEDTLAIEFTDVFQGKTTTRQVSYDLLGEPTLNYGAMGDVANTVSAWVDGALVTTWRREGAIAGTEVVPTEIRTLSEDRQTLTVEIIRDDRPSMIMVYDRVP